MKINEIHENRSFCNSFHAKSMKILPHNLLKIIKIDEKSTKIHRNSLKSIENQRKSTENPLKSKKIHKNLRNSMKIMKIIPLKFIKNHRKSMKINRKSIKIIEN